MTVPGSKDMYGMWKVWQFLEHLIDSFGRSEQDAGPKDSAVSPG